MTLKSVLGKFVLGATALSVLASPAAALTQAQKNRFKIIGQSSIAAKEIRRFELQRKLKIKIPRPTCLSCPPFNSRLNRLRNIQRAPR